MRWSREQLLGMGIMALLGGWVAIVGIQNNSALSPPPKEIQQVTVGDEWGYESYEPGYPETLRIKVLSARPTPDGRGRSIVCRYTHRYHRKGNAGYAGSQSHVETRSRDFLFTQYADGTMVWQGAIGSNDFSHIQLTTLQFLPVLRSPLVTGEPVVFQNYPIPSGRDTPPRMGQFQYEVTGVEGVRFERRRQGAYRVEINQTTQGGRGALKEKWTEWYAGYAFPVRREYTLSAPSDMPLPKFRLTLALVEFIPGKQ